MKLILNIPEVLISPFMKIVLLYRKIRYGYAFRRIELAEGKYAIIDAEDYERIAKYNWFLSSFGYARTIELIEGKDRHINMHSKIIQVEKGFVIDHANRNPLDNRKANLRQATRRQNACNKRTRPHSSIYRGVYLNKRIKKWRAAIITENGRIYLGDFGEEIEAAKAYDDAARKYHREFAVVNFEK